MKFFDCNAYIGFPAVRGLAEAATGADLLAEMDHCGVEQALVWHIAQHDAAPQTGNQLLADAIQAHPRLLGCWTILPNQANEFPPFDSFLSQMRSARVVAVRAYPISHHYLLNSVSMGDWLAGLVDHRVPLFLSVGRGADWGIIYSLLAEYPDLLCVICDHGSWGEDRRFRPLIDRYPHVYIETSLYLLDGGIESFVERYGPYRMLYGSGFPECYLGGMQMTIRHAQISDEAKIAIASGNLERILAEICWQAQL